MRVTIIVDSISVHRTFVLDNEIIQNYPKISILLKNQKYHIMLFSTKNIYYTSCTILLYIQ